MGVLCFGYAFGIIHKLLYSMDWVIALYGLNMVLVAFDLTLYFKYLPNERQGVASQHGGDDGDALEMLTRDDGHDGDVLQLFNNSRG
ncbi:MAG: hypothetical protein A4E63_01839 [Syntrophorhabdus sp. PtaU1.Bin050]|nr:MAG: hypothetical protein A4E63_01839 [Syntrophorhabdus sp. PtaU1.Bin050]